MRKGKQGKNAGESPSLTQFANSDRAAAGLAHMPTLA